MGPSLKILRIGLLVLVAPFLATAQACTIFVLTDGTRALFFNNEDWFNRVTRLWFVPAGKDHLGCAYVGFDNGWAQGGINTAGLAFDWVAGFEEKWKPGPELQPVRGNPSERMLESCTTVDDAIAFYRKYREPDFSRARILVADRSGASAVIGALNGQFHFVKLNRSRGYGWGRATLEKELAKSPEPTLANGAAILRACVQPGEGGTKYSNVFDLKSGDIFLFPSPQNEHVTLNLATELAKGGHYYDIPQIREQLAQAPRPLLNNMKRFVLDEFQPLPDQEPAITARIRALIQDASAGTLRRDDYTAELWEKISPRQKDLQADVRRLGDLTSLVLVGRQQDAGKRTYRYRVEFQKARVLGRYDLDEQDKVALIQTEGFEQKPGAVGLE
jgi:hypothetical protein